MLVNMDEDAVLGIRFLFTYHSAVLLLFRVNTHFNELLGIRYFVSCPRPLAFTVILISISMQY